MAESVLARIMREVMRQRTAEAGIKESPSELMGALDTAYELSSRPENYYATVIVADMAAMRASSHGRVREPIYYVFVQHGRTDLSAMPGLRAAYKNGVRIDGAAEHYQRGGSQVRVAQRG